MGYDLYISRNTDRCYDDVVRYFFFSIKIFQGVKCDLTPMYLHI